MRSYRFVAGWALAAIVIIVVVQSRYASFGVSSRGKKLRSIESLSNESLREIMLAPNQGIHPNLFALLACASFVAEQQVQASQRADIWRVNGNIYDVANEVIFYQRAAQLDDVFLIGEVGFNAGHSAITFLFANTNATLVSFDTGELPWSEKTLEMSQRIFPNRVERISGKSQQVLADFAEKDARKLDLLSIDGDHANGTPLVDLKNGYNASRKGGYILMDDWSESTPDVISAWNTATSEGWVKEVACVKDEVVHGFKKAYCLGIYT